MDYKFIILLVILLGLIFLLVKEMSSIREEINKNFDKTKNLSDTSIKVIDQKIQRGLLDTVRKIDKINADYMVSIRRMNELGSQPIIDPTSNNYTDSESIVKNKTNKIVYLSDAANDTFVKTQKSSVLISEHDTAKKKQCSDAFQINYSQCVEENKQHAKRNSDTKNDLVNTVKKQSELSPQIQSDNLVNKQTNNSTNEILNNISDDSDNDNDSDDNNNKSVEPDNCSENNEISDDDSDSNESFEENSDGVSIDIDPEIMSHDDNDNNKEEKKSVHSENSSITISLSKKKHDENEDASNNENNDENESLVTTDLILSLSSLKPLNKYNKTILEKIAKKYSIPITCKEGTTRRQLKKEELYEKIKVHLENEFSLKN